jgi:hypothetical protein
MARRVVGAGFFGGAVDLLHRPRRPRLSGSVRRLTVSRPEASAFGRAASPRKPMTPMTIRTPRAGLGRALRVLAGLALSLPCFEACYSAAEACPAGTNDCGDDICSVLALDPQNCGACGKACSSGEVCNDGACGVPCAFPADQRCDGECVELNDDPRHCGACDNACAASQMCFAGECRSL